jgi:hypothetical protein
MVTPAAGGGPCHSRTGCPMPTASVRRRKPTAPRFSSTARRKVDRPADLFSVSAVSAPHDVARLNAAQLSQIANGILRSAIDARHAVLAERWLAASGLTLPDSVDAETLRFGANKKCGDQRAPALVWRIRDVFDCSPCAIVRTYGLAWKCCRPAHLGQIVQQRDYDQRAGRHRARAAHCAFDRICFARNDARPSAYVGGARCERAREVSCTAWPGSDAHRRRRRAHGSGALDIRPRLSQPAGPGAKHQSGRSAKPACRSPQRPLALLDGW